MFYLLIQDDNTVFRSFVEIIGSKLSLSIFVEIMAHKIHGFWGNGSDYLTVTMIPINSE